MRPHHFRRQNSDVIAVPSGNGIEGTQTAGNPSATKLVVGSNTGPPPTGSPDNGPPPTDGPGFVPGSVAIFIHTSVTILIGFLHSRHSVILTSTSTSLGQPSHTPSETPAVSSATSAIPLSIVIGVCIGALVGAGLLICLAVWFYRRSSRRRPSRARQNHPLAQSRGVDPNAPWTKFDEDKWEGQDQVVVEVEKGPVGILPSEALRVTSLASNFGDQPREVPPFDQYHTRLSEETIEPPRTVEANQSRRSVDGSTAGTLLSLGTVHIESGKMSPTFNVAKMTPPATASKLHRWESAEVVDPNAQGQEVEVHPDPFSTQSTPTIYSSAEMSGDRRSIHNPFFNAHPGLHTQPSISKKSSVMSVSSDPFNKGDVVITIPKPKFISHVTHGSSSSGGSIGNERSMQNLIAALKLPQEVIEERLRVVSMNPSEASRYSRYSTGAESYVLPTPGTGEHGFVAQ